jgi:hypothetical protein
VYYDTARKGLIHYGPKPGLAFNILYPLNEPYFVCPLGLNYLYESFPVLPFFDVPTHRTANITLLSLPLKRLLGLKVNGEMTVPENALTRGTQGEATIPGKLLCGSLIDFSSFQTGYSCYVEGRIYWLVFIRRVK